MNLQDLLPRQRRSKGKRNTPRKRLPARRLTVEPLEALVLPSTVSDAAFLLLNTRAVENASTLTVYRDADSGFNHGTPSTTGVRAKVHLNMAALDLVSVPPGATPTTTTFDPSRGTSLQITFDPLTSGEVAGIQIVEPAPGLDLRGATHLFFDVRTPTTGGVVLQVGSHGGYTEFFHLDSSETYRTLEVPLKSLGQNARSSTIQSLFTLQTAGTQQPGGGVIYLDNIRFDRAPTALGGIPSLPTSTETLGEAATVDAALALLALSQRHTAEDLDSIRRIADAFVYALHNDNAGNPVPGTAPGQSALHNGYSNGSLPLAIDPNPAGGPEVGDARLAQRDGRPTLDGASAGSNAHAILALLEAASRLDDDRYRDAANSIGQWLVANLKDPSTSGFGGFFAGYPDSVTVRTLDRSKRTEDNAALFRAFQELARTAQAAGETAQAEVWRNASLSAGNFVLAMFDPFAGRFHAGTVPPGTLRSPGVDTTGPRLGNDIVNVFDYAEANTSAILALSGSPEYRDDIDWRRPMRFVLARFAREIVAEGISYKGFLPTGQVTSGPEGIAWETTGQVVAALRHVDQLYGTQEFATQAADYAAALARAQRSAPFGDGQGLVASTIVGSDSLPPAQQILTVPGESLPARVDLSATAWAVAADQRINLLAPAGLLQLSAPVYRVLEKDGFATVTILRVDGHAGAASVSYATRDGTARAGVHYTDIEGRLTFEEGQTSASFTIPILQKETLGGDVSFVVELSAAQGSALSDPAGAIVYVADATAGLTENQRYVARLYQDLLGRDVEGGGLAYWAGLLDLGVNRAVVIQSLLNSQEFLERTVRGLYRQILHREADGGGVAFFSTLLRQGVTIEEVTATLVGSDEYFHVRGGGTSAGFANALYNDLLNRPADENARNWIQRIFNLRIPRDRIALGLLGSDEVRRRRIDFAAASFDTTRPEGVFVGFYQTFLRRNADEGGRKLFVDLLRRGFTQQQVMGYFLASDEYFALS